MMRSQPEILSLERYGVLSEQLEVDSLRMPLCHTCSLALSDTDTFCSFCGYGMHALDSCAVMLRDWPVCRKCEFAASAELRRSDESAFADNIKRKHEEYSAAVQRASHVAEVAAFAAGAACQGIGSLLFGTLRGMLSASSVALNTSPRRELEDGGGDVASHAAPPPPHPDQQLFAVCKACTKGIKTSHRTHAKTGLCKKSPHIDATLAEFARVHGVPFDWSPSLPALPAAAAPVSFSPSESLVAVASDPLLDGAEPALSEDADGFLTV